MYTRWTLAELRLGVAARAQVGALISPRCDAGSDEDLVRFVLVARGVALWLFPMASAYADLPLVAPLHALVPDCDRKAPCHLGRWGTRTLAWLSDAR